MCVCVCLIERIAAPHAALHRIASSFDGNAFYVFAADRTGPDRTGPDDAPSKSLLLTVMANAVRMK